MLYSPTYCRLCANCGTYPTRCRCPTEMKWMLHVVNWLICRKGQSCRRECKNTRKLNFMHESFKIFTMLKMVLPKPVLGYCRNFKFHAFVRVCNCECCHPWWIPVVVTKVMWRRCCQHKTLCWHLTLLPSLFICCNASFCFPSTITCFFSLLFAFNNLSFYVWVVVILNPIIRWLVIRSLVIIRA